MVLIALALEVSTRAELTLSQVRLLTYDRVLLYELFHLHAEHEGGAFAGTF